MGAVTLLTFLVSPMVWAFFLYTIWMLYRGMTTNESLKWAEWRDEIGYGTAWRRALPEPRAKNPRLEGTVSRWPADARHILITTETGQPPQNPNLPGVGPWERVTSAGSLHNIYDVGFWNNLVDVFVPGYAFVSGRSTLPENAGGQRR
jgi:palmitoyltransferase